MLYLITILENYGEQEYTHYKLINSPSIEEAEIRAEKLAEKWYFDESKYIGKGYYVFFNGNITVELTNVEQITEEEFIKLFLI